MIYAPPYYREFRCIMGNCRHTCCAGWRIGVDEETERLYSTLEGKLGDDIRASLGYDEDGAYIPLNECGKCPHLDEAGLCRIISALGGGAVSYICREHPRFYNTLSDRTEVGLGASCEAAARLILASNEYLPTECVGECDASPEAGDAKERDRMLGILSDKSLSYGERIARLRREYAIPEELTARERWREVFEELEYASERNATLINCTHTDGAVDEVMLERYLAYLIYRHVTPASSETELRARLAFCLLSAEVLGDMAALTGAVSIDDYAELVRVYSEEIEYSEDNTDALIFELECEII